MIHLLLALVFASQGQASQTIATPASRVPVAEFSAEELHFACFNQRQPNRRTAKWVAVGIDYENGSGVVDFEVLTTSKLDFAVLKDPVRSVEVRNTPQGAHWEVRSSGTYEGSNVEIGLEIVPQDQGLSANYTITKGTEKYAGTGCKLAPPRQARGYEAVLKSYQEKAK